MAIRERQSLSAPWITGPLLFLGAFLLYFWTLARGPFPGVSAWALAQQGGIDPTAPLGSPLWGALVRLLKGLGPSSGFVFRVHLLGALGGAAGVWLMYELVRIIPHPHIEFDALAPPSGSAAPGGGRFPHRFWSGLAAALLLALSPPYWILSTRAHPQAVGVLLMLGSALLFGHFLFRRRSGLLPVFAFGYGLGVVEYPALWAFAPVVLFLALVGCWQQRRLTLRSLAAAGACFLPALLLYPLSAWRFFRDPAFDWYGFSTFGDALLNTARYQVRLFLSGGTRPGWLLIALLTVIPWFIVFVPKPAPSDRDTRIGFHLLFAILTVQILLLHYHGAFAPALYSAYDLYLPVFCFLAAMWGGCVIGFWLKNPDEQQAEGKASRRAVLVGSCCLALLLGAIPAGIGLAQGKPEREINRIAGGVLDAMESRTWLVSNGVLDPHLMLLAYERGQPVRVLNLASGSSLPYRKYAASLFEEARSRSLMRVSMAAWLNDWLADPVTARDTALLEWPDLWVRAQRVPLPLTLLYTAAEDLDRFDWEAWHAEQVAFWERLAAIAWPAAGDARSSADWLRRAAGKAANDAGVLLEEEGRDEQAYEAYAWARSIDPGNVSALLNQLAAAKRRSLPEQENLERLLEERTEKSALPGDARRLSDLYGYVRDPGIHAARGLAWAAAGRPVAGLRELHRAAALASEELDADLLTVLASLDGGIPVESEEALLRRRAEEPDNPTVLYGLFRLALRRGNLADAGDRLDALTKRTGPVPAWDVERGLLLAMEGRVEAADEILRAALSRDPSLLRGWAARALVAVATGNREAAERALREMLRIGEDRPDVWLSAAGIRRRMDDHEGARDLLARILRRTPHHPAALEMMLEYDWRDRRIGAVRERIQRLLSLDPGHALANYLLGVLQLADGEYRLAESSFRASVKRRPSLESMIDLAWLLQRRGEHDEAYGLALRALEAQPASTAAWHTLGLIQLRRGELEDASWCLEQALELDPGNEVASLYRAFLLHRQGDIETSRTAIRSILEQVDEGSLLPDIEREARSYLGP